MSKIIIAGCGYVGSKLAHELNNENQVIVFTRTSHNVTLLEQKYTTIQLDLDECNSVKCIDASDATIFYFIPPPLSGKTDSRLNCFLSNITDSKLPKKIVLISTTGVYGNCGSDWVDETTPVSPDAERAYRRLYAEEVLKVFCEKENIAYVVLRVPGIYGPDKLPLQRLVEEKPILKLSESPWSNRIHVDDLVQACICSLNYSGKFHLFNISDGNPSSMSDYFIQVAKSKGLKEPPQLSMHECEQIFSNNMMSYLKESKKIDNSLMLNELGVVLKYPTLVEGLRDDT